MAAKFPVINIDSETYLREVKISDAKSYFNYINHEDVRIFVPSNCIPTNLLLAERDMRFLIDLFKNKRGVYWSIADRKTDHLIGTCGFESWNKNNARVELIYDMDPKYWGKGIMHRALELSLIHI